MQNLLESHALLIHIFDNVEEAIFLIDENAKFVIVNEKACRSLGYSQEELLTLQVFDIDPDFTPQDWIYYKNGIFAGKLSATIKTRHKTKTGRIFPVEVKASVIFYQGKNYSLSRVRDISERKQHEEQLQLLNHAFNQVNEAIFLMSDDGRIFLINEKACRSLGYTREELLGMNVFDIDPTITVEDFDRFRMATGRGELPLIETYHKTKEGRIFPVEINASNITYQSKNYGMAVVRDITERKKSIRDLTLLNYAFENANDAIELIDEDGYFVMVNQKACSSLGYTREELLTLQVFDIDPDFKPEDWEEVKRKFKNGQSSVLLESRHKTKDDYVFPVDVHANYFEFDGKLHSLALIRDITQSKTTEKQLKLLNFALDHVGEAAWLIDEKAQFHYNNAQACRAIGYSREEMRQLGVPDIDPDYQMDIWPTHWQELKTHGSLFFESRHQTRDGYIFPVEINANYFEFEGQGYNLALIRDISQRKATEKQLKLLTFALDHIKESAWLIDENGWIHYVNQETCRATGYTRDELLRMNITAIGVDLPMKSWIIHWQELKASKAIRFEVNHKTKTGRIFPVEVNANYFEFDGQDYNLAFSHDITQRKQAEEALQHSEKLLAEAQRIAHIGSWEVDIANNQLFWSDETYRIWEIDKSQCSATIAAFYGKVHPEDLEKVTKARNTSIGSRTPYQVEHRLLFPDGRIKYIAERGEPFLDESGNIHRFGFVGTVMDITEQQHIKNTLEFVAQRGWKKSGESFLHALAQYLAQTLGVDYVIIDKLGTDTTQAETVALYVKGNVVPNILYDLNGTPCDGVANGKICAHPKNIQQLFPDDRLLVEMKAESYAGLPLWNTSGEVIGLIAVLDTKPMNDISFITAILQLVATSVAAELERQRSEQTLRQSEKQFRVLAETLPSPVFRFDKECRYIYMNPAAEKISGIAAEELLYKKAADVSPLNANEFRKVEQTIQRVLKTGQAQEEDVLFRVLATEQIYYFHNNYAPEFDANGNVASVIVISHDITERKRMEEELVKREQEFRALAENMPDNLTRHDKQGRVIYMNPAFMTSFAPEILPTIGMTLVEKFPNDDMALVGHKTVEHVLETGEEYEVELVLPNSRGEMRNHHVRYVAEYDQHGEIVGVIAIGRDITERKRIEKEMHYHASYDLLTGLPNRRMFNNRLRVEILKAERGNIRVTLLFIDLDNFKEVNDMLGHETGDRLLVEAAKRIQSCVRETDTVARLGGDEFVAILPEAGLIPPLERIAKSIIDLLAKPFQLDENVICISGSIGIAVYPQDATDADTLMGCADQAMYAAKDHGKNSFNFFTRSMQDQAHERLMLINNLRLAIEKEQLHVYYQPIVDVSTGKVVKAEALIRWIHPTLGMVSPAVFIPLAEETNLIQEIGTWIFYQAAHTAQQWNLDCGEDEHFKISINMSPLQLLRSDGDQMAIECLQKMNINPNFVVIEITEGLLLDNSPLILEKLERLQTTGVELSLDDFGTGYSAISYLKKFNLDYLKIDRSFVKDLETEESDVAIAEAIVMMAHCLGLKIIAEGVETQGQRDLLATLGCEYIQGYFYAKPMPKEEFLAFSI